MPEALPPANTKRWMARRKAAIVAAVANGQLAVDEACERYSLTIEELSSWQRLYQHGGVKGLRVTRTREYREALRTAEEGAA